MHIIDLDSTATQIANFLSSGKSIDNDSSVLILTPRDVNNLKEILDYAREKEVKVINYARVALAEPIDLFVGYDCGKIGQTLGQYLAETVDHGDYILLEGDLGDHNAVLLYEGAMRFISPLADDINIILDKDVPVLFTWI